MTAVAHIGPAPDRNLALELVRATEAAAIGGARHLGRGDKEAALVPPRVARLGVTYQF